MRRARVGSSCSSPVAGLLCSHKLNLGSSGETFISVCSSTSTSLDYVDSVLSSTGPTGADSDCSPPDLQIISDCFESSKISCDTCNKYSSRREDEKDFRPLEDVELLFENVLNPIIGLEKVNSEVGIKYGMYNKLILCCV